MYLLLVQLKFILAPWNCSLYSWWRENSLISLLWAIEKEERKCVTSAFLKLKSNLECVHCPLLSWLLHAYFLFFSLIWITIQTLLSWSCRFFSAAFEKAAPKPFNSNIIIFLTHGRQHSNVLWCWEAMFSAVTGEIQHCFSVLHPLFHAALQVSPGVSPWWLPTSWPSQTLAGKMRCPLSAQRDPAPIQTWASRDSYRNSKNMMLIR